MTISTAITQIDSLKPNSYTTAEKIGWLSELDARVVEELRGYLLSAEEQAAVDNFHGYTASDTGTSLLIPDTFSSAYIYWLASKIDFFNMELDKYNAAASEFNGLWIDYKNWFNRTHTHKQTKIKYF